MSKDILDLWRRCIARVQDDGKETTISALLCAAAWVEKLPLHEEFLRALFDLLDPAATLLASEDGQVGSLGFCVVGEEQIVSFVCCHIPWVQSFRGSNHSIISDFFLSSFYNDLVGGVVDIMMIQRMIVLMHIIIVVVVVFGGDIVRDMAPGNTHCSASNWFPLTLFFITICFVQIREAAAEFLLVYFDVLPTSDAVSFTVNFLFFFNFFQLSLFPLFSTTHSTIFFHSHSHIISLILFPFFHSFIHIFLLSFIFSSFIFYLSFSFSSLIHIFLFFPLSNYPEHTEYNDAPHWLLSHWNRSGWRMSDFVHESFFSLSIYLSIYLSLSLSLCSLSLTDSCLRWMPLYIAFSDGFSRLYSFSSELSSPNCSSGQCVFFSQALYFLHCPYIFVYLRKILAHSFSSELSSPNCSSGQCVFFSQALYFLHCPYIFVYLRKILAHVCDKIEILFETPTVINEKFWMLFVLILPHSVSAICFDFWRSLGRCAATAATSSSGVSLPSRYCQVLLPSLLQKCTFPSSFAPSDGGSALLFGDPHRTHSGFFYWGYLWLK